MFNIQRSQVNQQEFEPLAEILMKYPIAYGTK